MPSGVVSHQAPGLLLKVKYPKKFDGTTICIGTLVPDLNALIDLFFPYHFRNITHSFLGLFIYTIPLTLILTILFCKYIAPMVSRVVKRESKIYNPLKYFGLDDWDVFKNKKFNSTFFIVAAYSALIGGMTHILIDLPAHKYNVLFFPIITLSPDFLLYSIVDFGPFNIGPYVINRNLTIYQLLWIIEDTIALLSTLYLLRYIKKHRLISEWYKQTPGVN
ncbi:MAG: DUF4184 family protein [Promethearchaeota archaeon]|jgi:hypothetical protein